MYVTFSSVSSYSRLSIFLYAQIHTQLAFELVLWISDGERNRASSSANCSSRRGKVLTADLAASFRVLESFDVALCVREIYILCSVGRRSMLLVVERARWNFRERERGKFYRKIHLRCAARSSFSTCGHVRCRARTYACINAGGIHALSNNRRDDESSACKRERATLVCIREQYQGRV